MSLDKVSLFVNTCHNRGNKALLMAHVYGAALTNAQKDELLTCRRIAKRKDEQSKIRGAVCV